MIRSFSRARRGNRLLGTTYFIVLTNFLRMGIVDFLREWPGHAATLDEIVAFCFATATRSDPEDIELLLQHYQRAANPNKLEFVHFLVQNARWSKARRSEVNSTAPSTEVTDWNPLVRALHEQFDPKFAGSDPAKRQAARAHWNSILTMTDAFDIARYDDGSVQLSEGELASLQRELELFGESHYGVDDLLGVLVPRSAWS